MEEGVMADEPSRRSLDSLKNEARRWLKQLRRGEQTARERFERALPHLSKTPSLRDVQHALAREHGFPGWKAITEAIDAHRGEGERSLARYEAAASALLDAYRTGTPHAMERHYSYTWHRRPWAAMRTYVQLDLGKRPAHPADEVEITIDDARYLVALEHDFANWDELRRFTATGPAAAFETAKPMSVTVSGADDDSHAIGRARDWDSIVSLLSERPSAELHAHGQMTDEALARLGSLESITGLALAGSRAVTDHGIQHLARLPRLERLDLSRTGITDRGLEILCQLPTLRSISLAGTQITDDGAAHLARCDALEIVDLSWTNTGDGAIRALAGKAALREFTTGVKVTDAGIFFLHDLPQFKRAHGREARLSLLGRRALPNHLSLHGPITDAGVAALHGLDGLFSLDVDDSRIGVTAAGLRPLIDLPHLGALSIDAKDDWMPSIAAMPRLRALTVQDTIAGDDGFRALGRSRSLEFIWGRRCYNLRRRGFVALANIPTLIGLSVSCLNVDDEGIATLPAFPSLRELMPMDVPDDGYRHIANCERLEALVLMYCRETTDRATEHIRNMRLTYYFNSYTTITDRTPELLSAMDSLERVIFDACHELTDAGVGQLARLPRLHELRVSGRGLTPAVVQAFPSSVAVSYC
jgi:hypothetical protein